MSLAAETSQEEMSPSKEAAFWNAPIMLVTDETSQEEMSPSKEEAPWNMWRMLVTSDRSGESAARYTIDDAPSNANSIDSHCVSPHWSMDRSFAALASPLRWILVKSPDMLTV